MSVVCRTCALFLLVKLFRLLHVQRVEREVLQRVPASLEAWMKWIKWMKWMKSDMSLYDSPHALHLEDIIRSIVCSYYSSIGHIGSYRISSDQTTDFLSIDVPIIFESFIEILRSQKKKTTCCLDDLQRRQHQIRIAMFELRKYVGISSLTGR